MRTGPDAGNTGRRDPRVRLLGLAAVAVAGGIALWMAGGDGGQDGGEVTFLGTPVAPERIALGRDLYAGNCAACHGAEREGAPDWKTRQPDGRMPAPPHDASGHTWHHSDRQLFALTKLGVSALVPGYESDMPGFADVLTDAEIAAVLAWIKSTWPERERAFQAKVTENDRGGS